jgi:hypothetical protein
MTVALVAALVVVVLGSFWLLDRRDERSRVERAELLNHLQGERMPSSPERWIPRPEPEPDEFTRVGVIESDE